MGLSSSKSKATPIVSPWMETNLQGYAGSVNSFLGMDPTQFVAPASELQTKAFADAQNLGGWKTSADQALGMAADAGGRGPASAQATLSGQHSIFDDGGIQKYMDPALQSYVNTALASYDADTDRRYAQMQAEGAKNGAFGGSRYGVALGDFQAEAGRGRAMTEAELMRQAYAQALQTAMGEADRFQQTDISNAGLQTHTALSNAQLQEQAYQRALQAAGITADISNSMAANERGDLALVGQLGQMERGIDSEYRNAIPTQLQIAGNLYGAIPPSAYVGQQTKSKQALGPILGGIASSAASVFSDRRMKTDVARIGSHGSLPVYRFRYLWEDIPRLGVMADEVAIHAPEALGPPIGGYATVDYGELGLAHLVEGN